MSVALSNTVKGLSSSLTLQINASVADLRAQGIPVISLGAGEPDFDTPPHIRRAAVQAMENGCTRYTSVSGLLPLRQAISKHIKKQKNLHYSPQEILVGAGVKQVLFEALQALINPGDEVLLPLPCWVSYPEMIRIAGGVPVPVSATADSGFLPAIDQLAAAVTPRTKALILNTPANPSGAVWPPSLVKAVMSLAQTHHLFVISDEIYEDLVFGGASHLSPAAVSQDAFERTIVLSGLSKAYAMTGWRVGYAAGPQSVVAAMTALQSHTSGSINTIAQYAALEALTAPQSCVQEMRDTFARRRKLLLHLLKEADLHPGVIPQGAFYLLLDIRPFLGKGMDQEVICDDLCFAQLLLQKQHVAVVPGAAFGAEGFVRLSYAASEQDLTCAVQRIGDFVRSLK